MLFLYDLHHSASHAEAGARLHAEAFVRRRSIGATFAHVPRQTRPGLVGVAHVWCGLVAQRYGVEGHHEAVDEESQEREEEVHDEHDYFAELDEHAKDRDGDVEGCRAVGC